MFGDLLELASCMSWDSSRAARHLANAARISDAVAESEIAQLLTVARAGEWGTARTLRVFVTTLQTYASALSVDPRPLTSRTVSLSSGRSEPSTSAIRKATAPLPAPRTTTESEDDDIEMLDAPPPSLKPRQSASATATKRKTPPASGDEDGALDAAKKRRAGVNERDVGRQEQGKHQPAQARRPPVEGTPIAAKPFTGGASKPRTQFEVVVDRPLTTRSAPKIKGE